MPPNKKVVAASARAFLRRDEGHYDLIVLDVYTNTFSIPMETTTRDFLLDVKKRLKAGGIVVANILASPTFDDRFSIRYDNTFASVFPAYTRELVSSFQPWKDLWPKQERPQINNALYIYIDNPHAGDDGVYTDDKNTYSLDRP